MIRRELLSMKKIILTAAVCLGGYVPLQGQVSLTIEKAMDIAEEHSPSLRRSHMNLERYQQNLVAQRASLKSKFSLNLNPVDYSKSRSFDNRLSQWYTNERFSATGTFQVDQPILWTDGVLSLINRFGWQDNNSNIDGTKTSNKAFSNDLYLQLSQPIFTYNKRKMELQQIEYDYENANISYALQRLSTEKDITQQFYSVYMAQSQLAITREELTNAQQSYEIIKNKVEADLAARDELFQAEVNLASARSSLEEQQVSLENSKDQLKQTLGMDLNEDIMVFAEVQIKPVEVNLEKAIQHGLESRLELRQREIESKELAFDMIKTKALNEFKGDIALSFGLIGDNRHLEKIYNNPTQNPRVAISFSVPIFDWGEKKARVKAQEVAQKIGHEQKRLRRLQRRVALQLSAVELIDGVEVHRCNARAGKERREIDSLPDGLHIRVQRIAVRARIGQQLAVFVKQAVIDAPGVDADAVKLSHICVLERQQTLLQLVVEIRQIPVKDAVHLDVVVFKPVQLAHGELLAVELAQNRAAVARAEVERQQVSHGVMPLSF